MQSPFEFLVVLDFEATCKPNEVPEPQEIIEFPSVLLSLTEGRVVDEFESFVRPVHHPKLSEFCTELTSIQQAEVDGADPFLVVLARHQAWLRGHGLLDPGPGGADRFAFVTCGDWDLATMLPVQCAASALAMTDLPRVYRRWLNIKKVFSAVKRREKGSGMPSMLRALGLTLEGRHHRGIDDCRNIAKITFALAALGGRMELTGRLSSSRYPELPITLRWRDQTQEAVLRKRVVATLLGLASGLFRTKIVRVLAEDGAVIDDDEALTELAPGSTLQVVSARD